MSETLGFIGLGIMGKPMAKNLIDAGYKLVVFDINTRNSRGVSQSVLMLCSFMVNLHERNNSRCNVK